MRLSPLLLVLGLFLAGCSSTAKAQRAASIDQSQITPTGCTVRVRTITSVASFDDELFHEAVARAALGGLFRAIEPDQPDYVLEARLAEVSSEKVALGDMQGLVTISWTCRKNGVDEPVWREIVTGKYQSHSRDRSTMWTRGQIAEDEALRVALQKSMEKLSRVFEKSGGTR